MSQRQNESDSEYLKRVCDFIVASILFYGGSEYTAYICAAEFAKGIRASWETPQ